MAFDLGRPWVEGQLLAGCPGGISRRVANLPPSWLAALDGAIGDGAYTLTVTRGDGVAATATISRDAGLLVVDGEGDPEQPLDDAAAVVAALLAAAVVADGMLELVDLAADAADLEVVGRVAGVPLEVSLVAPAGVQVWRVVDDADGGYALALAFDGGEPFDVAATATANTPAQIAAALLAAAGALDPSPPAEITADGADGVRIAVDEAGVILEVTPTSPADGLELDLEASTTAAWEVVQLADAGGETVLAGRFVVLAVDGSVRLPQPDDTAASLEGFVPRTHLAARSSGAPDEVPASAPGRTVVPQRGQAGPVEAVVRNAGATAATPGAAVYVYREGSATLRGCAAVSDGSATVAPTGFRAQWLDLTGPGQLGRILLRR